MHNAGKAVTVTTTTVVGAVDAVAPLVFYLVAGQTISTVKVGENTTLVKSQICVTEVPA